MGKPKAPSAPDPQATATAQTGTNVSTAIANANLGNVNQVTPYGNLTYSESGTYKWTDPTSGKQFDVPKFTATTTLSPEQQAILNQNNKTDLTAATLANTQMQQLQKTLANPFTLSGLPAAADPSKIATPEYQQFGAGPKLQTSVAGSGDITKNYNVDFDTSGYQNAMMGRLQPTIDRDRASLETNLQNQGIRIGSDAWTNAMADFDRGVNDQRTSVLLASGQEQSRLAGLARDQATFQNSAQQQGYDQNYSSAGFSNSANQQMYQNQTSSTAANNALKDQLTNTQLAQFNAQNTTRQNAINEAYGVRNQNLNEPIALASGAQVQNPNFVSTNMPQIPTTDYAGIVQQGYQNQLGAYNTQMSNYNGILGGLFGLGASAIKASDRRLKRDIRRIGTYRNGLPKYEFRYRHGGRRHVGLMSDDVRKFRPDAVIKIVGYDAVNYRKALA